MQSTIFVKFLHYLRPKVCEISLFNLFIQFFTQRNCISFTHTPNIVKWYEFVICQNVQPVFVLHMELKRTSSEKRRNTQNRYNTIM